MILYFFVLIEKFRVNPEHIGMFTWCLVTLAAVGLIIICFFIISLKQKWKKSRHKRPKRKVRNMNRRVQAINSFPQSPAITAIECSEENNPSAVDVVADVITWSAQHSQSKYDGNFRGVRAINSFCQISMTARNDIANENTPTDAEAAVDIVILQ